LPGGFSIICTTTAPIGTVAGTGVGLGVGVGGAAVGVELLAGVLPPQAVNSIDVPIASENRIQRERLKKGKYEEYRRIRKPPLLSSI
jgi:hypothetical protein